MKWLKRHWRAMVRVIGIILILVSGGVAFLWFYWLVPWKHVIDPAWRRHHSSKTYWEELKTSIQRRGWTHDDGFAASGCGDKEFMVWTMAHTSPDDTIVDCLGSHRDSAFSMITNHNPGDTAKDWLGWWKKNQSKSQIEWIQEGFIPYGVTVNIPPSDSNTIPLLKLLGNTATHKDEYEQEIPVIPGFIRYNAFRWLRDSNFNPVEFVLNNPTNSLDPLVKTGLLEYYYYDNSEGLWQRQEKVGHLYFDGKPDSHTNNDVPEILTFTGQIIVNSIIFGLLLSGVGLILWTCRKPRRDKTKTITV